jgi:hypothetical protein
MKRKAQFGHEPARKLLTSSYQSNLERTINVSSLGTFLYPVCEIGETRNNYIYRKIDDFYLEKLKLSIVNNLLGKYFRSFLIVNIYPKPANQVEEYLVKEVSLLRDKIQMCHQHPNRSVFYSIVRSTCFRKYYCMEVIDGIHTVTAIKQILCDPSIENSIKENIGLEYEGMVNAFYCAFYFDLGDKFIKFCIKFFYSNFTKQMNVWQEKSHVIQTKLQAQLRSLEQSRLSEVLATSLELWKM